LSVLAPNECLESAFQLFDEMTERDFVFSTLLFGMFVWRVCGVRVVSLLDEVRECCFGINGSVGGFDCS